MTSTPRGLQLFQGALALRPAAVHGDDGKIRQLLRGEVTRSTSSSGARSSSSVIPAALGLRTAMDW